MSLILFSFTAEIPLPPEKKGGEGGFSFVLVSNHPTKFLTGNKLIVPEPIWPVTVIVKWSPCPHLHPQAFPSYFLPPTLWRRGSDRTPWCASGRQPAKVKPTTHGGSNTGETEGNFLVQPWELLLCRQRRPKPGEQDPAQALCLTHTWSRTPRVNWAGWVLPKAEVRRSCSTAKTRQMSSNM